MELRSPFLFAVSQVGAERALKEEVAFATPNLHASFQRPGFLTFKANTPLELEVRVPSLFARTSGLSWGEGSIDDVIARARALHEAHGDVRLHVFPRDRYVTGEEPDGLDPLVSTRALVDALKGKLDPWPEWLRTGPALPGEVVLDVMDVDDAPDGGSEWWVGAHRHNAGRSPFAGGHPRLTLPGEAPSRAWLKLEEALLWSGAPLRRGDFVIDVGSAPGGASHALLERGCKVTGIDPNAMDPRILAHKRFRHIRFTVGAVRDHQLPDEAQWVLLDINLPPRTALHNIAPLIDAYGHSLVGAILTLKLGRWEMASEIPDMLEKVRRLSSQVVEVRATQLPSNRQEICIVALTRRAHARG